MITLPGETMYSSGTIFVTKRKIRHFRPKKIKSIFSWSTSESKGEALHLDMIILLGEIFVTFQKFEK